MISLEKWMILTPLQKLPKNVGDLGKLIVAKGFHTVSRPPNALIHFQDYWLVRIRVTRLGDFLNFCVTFFL